MTSPTASCSLRFEWIPASSWWLTGGAVLLTLAGLIYPARAVAQSDDKVVTKLCLAGFSAAFQAARQVAPPGMSSYTCSCFVDQINQGADLGAAQSTCRERASARYRL